MAAIFTINKGFTMVYVTDQMGVVSLRAETDRNGDKRCFVKRHDELAPEWKPYGIENYETIVSLSKYQING